MRAIIDYVSKAMSEPWWSGFFDETYASIGLENRSPEDEAALAPTIDLILATLMVKPGDLVFDQCCGIGRLTIPVARRGVRVIGVDQAERYIEIAKSRAAGLDCELFAGDAFDFVAPRPCDAAFNWFTSF